MRLVPTEKNHEAQNQAIIGAAIALIEARDDINFTLADIAKRASCSMREVQQHFKDPLDIVEVIFESYLDEIRDGMKSNLSVCKEWEDLDGALHNVVHFFYDQTKFDKTMRVIWVHFREYPQLNKLEQKDTHVNARLIAEHIHRFIPHRDYDEIFNPVWLMIQAISHTATVAQSMPEHDANQIVAEFNRLLTLRLQSLREENPED